MAKTVIWSFLFVCAGTTEVDLFIPCKNVTSRLSRLPEPVQVARVGKRPVWASCADSGYQIDRTEAIEFRLSRSFQFVIVVEAVLCRSHGKGPQKEGENRRIDWYIALSLSEK